MNLALDRHWFYESDCVPATLYLGRSRRTEGLWIKPRAGIEEATTEFHRTKEEGQGESSICVFFPGHIWEVAARHPVHSIIRKGTQPGTQSSQTSNCCLQMQGVWWDLKCSSPNAFSPAPLVFKPMWIPREIESICFWFIYTELIKM